MKRIVIIGAGIVGISAAYHLMGEGEIVVIDRGDVGRATDAAAGIVCPWVAQRRNKAWYALAKGGAAYYPQVIEALRAAGETDTGYARVGALAQHEEKKLNEMRERTLLRREDAPEIGEVNLRTNEEARALFPPLADTYDALHVEGGARVDGKRLREALERVVVRNGVRLVTGTAELALDGEKLVARVGEETFEADEWILACGAWLPELLDPLGYDVAIRAEKAQIVHVRLPEADGSERWPVVMPPRRAYLLSFEDGHVVIGSTHEKEKAFDTRPTVIGVHEVLTKALDSAPGLAEAELVETRVGYRPFAPSSLPVLGRLDRHPNVVVVNGLGSSGLTIGPFIGKVVADLTLGRPSEINFDEYSVSDFVKPR